MKEIITIEIGEKNKASENHSKALAVVPTTTQKTGFKQFVSKIWEFLIGKELTDSSALLKLGIAVKKYRFSLAIIGLVFMLIFRNDSTKAIGLKIDENKEISLKNEPMESISKAKDLPKVKKSAQTKNTVSRNNASINDAEAIKSYHIPNIPELSNRKKISGDLGKNSAKAIDLYISKYLKLAKEETVKTKIPTSVILGLALMNSSYGLSKTALNANNHFEIKCAENSIPMGKGMKGQYVSNDFCFTEYNTVWASYRAHSNLLLKAVKKYSDSGQITVMSLTNSLEKSGYFNNRGFSADDLLQFIEENNLNKFNQ